MESPCADVGAEFGLSEEGAVPLRTAPGSIASSADSAIAASKLRCSAIEPLLMTVPGYRRLIADRIAGKDLAPY